jgi:hemerythrin-like domain-containing protein
MEGPIRSVRYIHKVIQAELGTLEGAVAQLQPGDGTQAAEIEGRFGFLHDTVKSHHKGEEDALLPAIDERACPVSAPYLLDHRTDQGHLHEIVASFLRFAGTGDKGERAELLRRLNRLTIIVRSSMTVHIQKEEEILIPLIEEHFSFEEQADIVKRAVAHFSPEQQRHVSPWMLKALTQDEQGDYLRLLAEGMPPEAFQTMIGWIAEGVSPREWVQIVRRLPGAT